MTRAMLIRIINFMILRCEITNYNETIWDQKYALSAYKVRNLVEIEVGWVARYAGGAETGAEAHQTLMRLLGLLAYPAAPYEAGISKEYRLNV